MLKDLELSPIVRGAYDRFKRSTVIRLALLPDETNLVYWIVRREAGVPRVMVDVGAHFGSTLWPFAADGWVVVAFEPDADNRRVLEHAVQAFPNVTLDARAISDRCATEVPFYTSPRSSGISSLVAFDSQHVQRMSVSTTTLATACAEHALHEIGVLKVDVEGLDFMVLAGVPWEHSPPHVIICEFEDAKSVKLGYAFDDLVRYLIERGYTILVSEWYPVVEYGTEHRWRRLARYPCTLEDERCFGNLLAFRDVNLAGMAQGLARRFAPMWRAVTTTRHALGQTASSR